MKNSALILIAYFNTALSGWFSRKNNSDCLTFDLNQQSDYPVELFKKNFRIKSQEILLFARDTSSWNNRDQGLVMTNLGIYLIEDKKNSTDRRFISWADIDTVQYVKNSSAFRFKLKDGSKIMITSNSFFKRIDKKELDKVVGNLLAKHLIKLSSLDEKRCKQNEKALTIERVCPCCGGKIDTVTITFEKSKLYDNQGKIYGHSFSSNDHIDMLTWYAIIDRDLILDGEVLFANEIGVWDFSHKRCEKCNHIWDLLDETEAILSSKDEHLIHAYTSYVENIVPNKVENKWVWKIIKTRLYFSQYLEQSNKQSLDDYKKSRNKAKKCHTNNQYLLDYEERIMTEMSNAIESLKFCDGIISPTRYEAHEQEYLKSCYKILVNGPISDGDRRKLERKRKSLGISKFYADEMEAVLSSKMKEQQ